MQAGFRFETLMRFSEENSDGSLVWCRGCIFICSYEGGWKRINCWGFSSSVNRATSEGSVKRNCGSWKINGIQNTNWFFELEGYIHFSFTISFEWRALALYDSKMDIKAIKQVHLTISFGKLTNPDKILSLYTSQSTHNCFTVLEWGRT